MIQLHLVIVTNTLTDVEKNVVESLARRLVEEIRLWMMYYERNTSPLDKDFHDFAKNLIAGYNFSIAEVIESEVEDK